MEVQSASTRRPHRGHSSSSSKRPNPKGPRLRSIPPSGYGRKRNHYREHVLPLPPSQPLPFCPLLGNMQDLPRVGGTDSLQDLIRRVTPVINGLGSQDVTALIVLCTNARAGLTTQQDVKKMRKSLEASVARLHLEGAEALYRRIPTEMRTKVDRQIGFARTYRRKCWWNNTIDACLVFSKAAQAILLLTM